MRESLQDKVALVTGAGAVDGIGWTTVCRLAELGARVVATDIEAGEGIGAELERAPLAGRVEFARLDVTSSDAIERCVDDVIQRLGGIDILVNNAGTTVGSGAFLDIDADHWLPSFRVNAIGPGLLMQAVIPVMRRRGGGAIVNNASTAGIGAEAGFGVYSASKHALVALTKTVAAEFGPDNIRCNAVCPGYVATEMHESVNRRLAAEQGVDIDAIRQQRYAGVALRRAGSAAEIAATIAFLAGPESGYINGAAIPVSGGTPVGL